MADAISHMTVVAPPCTGVAHTSRPAKSKTRMSPEPSANGHVRCTTFDRTGLVEGRSSPSTCTTVAAPWAVTRISSSHHPDCAEKNCETNSMTIARPASPVMTTRSGYHTGARPETSPTVTHDAPESTERRTSPRGSMLKPLPRYRVQKSTDTVSIFAGRG